MNAAVKPVGTPPGLPAEAAGTAPLTASAGAASAGAARIGGLATPKDHAATIAEHFKAYNEEFGRITRRAAMNFLAEDWRAGQLDAVARIELYEQRVARCVAVMDAELR